jgi:hypothetical protein
MLIRRARNDENGLVGVVLVIVIVWALLAVLELTRTTVAAEEINHTVTVITGNVGAANVHLSTGCAPGNCPTDALPVLNTTIDLASKINTAALPLTGQLATVKTDTGQIDTTAKAILGNATSINTTVQSIHSLVLSIAGSVATIHSSFVGINGLVQNDITPGLIKATGQAQVVVDEVNAITHDTDVIDGQAKGILVQATAICADQPVTLLGAPLLGALAGKSICAKG